MNLSIWLLTIVTDTHDVYAHQFVVMHMGLMFPPIVFRPGAVFYKVTGGSQCRAGGGGEDSGAAAC